MLFEITLLFLAMLLIVASSELFTNGIEWLGQRLDLNEGVVGSIFAAIGTALPETLVPLVAVLSFGHQQGNEVSVGAITGSPFMLSTLTLGLCGAFVYIFHKRGLRPLEISADTRVLKRDLSFFLIAFSLVFISIFAPPEPVLRTVLGICIFLIYPVYIVVTLKAEGDIGEEPGTLYVSRLLTKIGLGEGELPAGKASRSSNLGLILFQVFSAVGGITCGAYFFVNQIQDVSQSLGFPAQVLSIIISPIATEFPEKMNSILWLRKGKDTLALGNVTGALVFQSTILGGFGVACTRWNLGIDARVGVTIALISATLIYVMVLKKSLNFKFLSLGILVYAAAITFFQISP